MSEEFVVRDVDVALVHEWFVTYAGSERVVEQMLKVCPEARLFSLVNFMTKDPPAFLRDREVNTTFIQHLPFARKLYRQYLGLMPIAIEQLNVTGADVVVSSHHCISHGVICRPDQVHVSYTHSPIRYAWDLQFEYLREANMTWGLKSMFARWILHKMRMWDVAAAARVDRFYGNSKYIAERIRRCYRRKAGVLYPSVAVQDFPLHEQKEDFYLAASRLVPYKRIGAIVDAFKLLPDRKLIVIGDGPEYQRIEKRAGANVELIGHQKFEVLKSTMQTARAFLFAAEEDFGIIPVEAQACGTPVIAFGKGGACETVVDGKTGIFFKDREPETIAAAVREFESREKSFVAAEIRQHSESFSEEVFRRRFAKIIDRAMTLRQKRRVANHRRAASYE